MDSIEKRFEELDNPLRTGYLIGGFITGSLTIEEREELDSWVVASEQNMQLFEDMTDDSKVKEFARWLTTIDTETRLKSVKKRIQFAPRKKTRSIWKYAMAASILAFSAFLLYVSFEKKGRKVETEMVVKADIAPGKEVAVLRLPGGRIIQLNEEVDTSFGGIHVGGGEISYEQMKGTEVHEVVIPGKGFYKLSLPDGTKVWLNSKSSIRYPSAFEGNSREVEVTGETYFEVAKDADKPFIVLVNGIEVQAIGTAFNINGFDQRITLTEGKVLVRKDMRMMMLNPGEQVDASFHKTKIDINPVIAWTRNEFSFKNSTIKEIMKTLSRWYDCEVIYEDEISYHFNGTIERKVPISRVLQLLEGTGHVRFSIKNNTVTVRK